MSIKILKTKLLKPSIPTPPNLRNYKLSFIDEILPLMEVGVLLFYSSKPTQLNLEESLAQVLSSFYPLAGRFLLQDHIVDCSDQGAEFLEAQSPHTTLHSLLLQTDLEHLYPFLPRKNHHQELPSYPILSIQITHLQCEGLVIGISISHKIFDVSSLSTFIAAWSKAASAVPTFDASLHFPSRNQSISPSAAAIRSLDTSRVAVKRFTFNKEAIATLRSNASPSCRISKVRAVSAVIVKTLMSIDEKARDCVVTQAVNMRERTSPALQKQACGNLVLLSVTRVGAGAGVEEVGRVLGDATRKAVSECGGILGLDEDRRNEMVMNPLREASRAFMGGEENVVTLTDYSKFEFYESDMGWGRPVWASIAPHTSGNTVVVMGNREGDGIEAWLHLDKNHMSLFQKDAQIIRLCGLQT